MLTMVKNKKVLFLSLPVLGFPRGSSVNNLPTSAGPARPRLEKIAFKKILLC